MDGNYTPNKDGINKCFALWKIGAVSPFEKRIDSYEDLPFLGYNIA